MNITELREQICGKEPVTAIDDKELNKLVNQYQTRIMLFNATAAAILELVKERVPGEREPTGTDESEYDFCGGNNYCRAEILTTIENLKNELK